MLETIIVGIVGVILGAVIIIIWLVNTDIPEDYKPITYQPSQEMLKTHYDEINARFSGMENELKGIRKDFNKYVDWRVKRSK